ncbi:hypothetical protein GJ496_003825 [Pomphorhynchus laevis]|nr:hypothetical protein GJ496_003825 [Pomphorhynchus laevis]
MDVYIIYELVATLSTHMLLVAVATTAMGCRSKEPLTNVRTTIKQGIVSNVLVMYRLSCVGLAKRQASAIPIWRCSKCLHKPTFSDCRSTVTQVFPDNKTTTLLNYIAMCRRSHKVLPRIPKGAIVCVAQSLDRLLKDTIKLEDEVY